MPVTFIPIVCTCMVKSGLGILLDPLNGDGKVLKIHSCLSHATSHLRLKTSWKWYHAIAKTSAETDVIVSEAGWNVADCAGNVRGKPTQMSHTRIVNVKMKNTKYRNQADLICILFLNVMHAKGFHTKGYRFQQMLVWTGTRYHVMHRVQVPLYTKRQNWELARKAAGQFSLRVLLSVKTRTVSSASVTR